jgi:hypothetical protein
MTDPKMLRKELRRDVRVMRALGVARWDRDDQTIYLGPPPPAPHTERTVEQEIARRNEAVRREHETLFAATSTRPTAPEAVNRASVLESVVPRPKAQEHDSGGQATKQQQ